MFKPGDKVYLASSLVGNEKRHVELVAYIGNDELNYDQDWWAWDDKDKVMCRTLWPILGGRRICRTLRWKSLSGCR